MRKQRLSRTIVELLPFQKQDGYRKMSSFWQSILAKQQGPTQFLSGKTNYSIILARIQTNSESEHFLATCAPMTFNSKRPLKIGHSYLQMTIMFYGPMTCAVGRRRSPIQYQNMRSERVLIRIQMSSTTMVVQ